MRVYFLMSVVFLVAFPSYLHALPSLIVESDTGSLTLDREELEAFPQTTITTESPYYSGSVEFSGPTLQRIVEHFGVNGKVQITLQALNDYQVVGSLEEMLGLGAIIATRKNSKPMSVRDRGPFWIMLPLSERPELNHEDFHRYMVWQLNRIVLD